MKTIWKYELEVTDSQTILMPEGAELLTIQNQNGSPCLWAMVDPEETKKPIGLITYGTGHPMDNHGDNDKYIGSYLFANDRLVFHVFAVVE